MTINFTKPYHVYLHGQVVESGSYQECLNYIEDKGNDEMHISRTKADKEELYVLEELPIDYTITDDSGEEDDREYDEK